MSRVTRVERARIFVGCEGESENGYAVCVANLARVHELPVTVDAHVMREGDPMSRIQWAQARIEQQEARRGAYAAKFAFLDTDQRDQNRERAMQAIVLAAQLGITIVWQEPDHEGLLLHHFENDEKRRPRTKVESMRAVLKVWPAYEKNSTAQQYGRKLALANVERAGSRHAELNEFLMTIGLVKRPDVEPPVPKAPI